MNPQKETSPPGGLRHVRHEAAENETTRRARLPGPGAGSDLARGQ
ncbi:MAG: hypothetical protein ACRENB_00145 [Gemmatimonadales bacterium]